jgi:hypothetical protein
MPCLDVGAMGRPRVASHGRVPRRLAALGDAFSQLDLSNVERRPLPRNARKIRISLQM